MHYGIFYIFHVLEIYEIYRADYHGPVMNKIYKENCIILRIIGKM